MVSRLAVAQVKAGSIPAPYSNSVKEVHNAFTMYKM